ncbi:MAG: glycosyltransferase family 4 protein [Verrucomicrobiales bacterium]
MIDSAMRIVFLNQYYPPDAAPTGVMLEAVARELVAQGHEVTVICAEGGYAGSKTEDRETEDRRRGSMTTDQGLRTKDAPQALGHGPPTLSGHARLLRIGATRFGRVSFVGKLLDYLSYYLGVAWKLGTMRPAPERMVALTTPPYLSVLARMMSRLRGGTHAHWVMDIYPDVMVSHGMLQEGGLLQRMLAWLARWGWGGKRCGMILTLGPCMADRLRRVLGSGASLNAGNLQHVPLWSGAEREVAEAELKDLRAARGWREGEVVVMYSGNMGLGHRFGELFAAIVELSASSPGKFRFVFFGKGRRRAEVEAFLKDHPDLPIELHDYVAEEDLAAHLRSADLHVASLDPAWTGTMLPSKLQGIFAAGRPVVFIGGEDSSMAAWVRESGAGWVVAPGNDQALMAALLAALDGDLLRRMGQRAAEFGKRHFQKESNVSAAAAALTRLHSGKKA